MTSQATLRVGLIGESQATVTDELTAIQVGSGNLPVYATPAMIALMESAAVSAVHANLPDGSTSVGIELHVRHLSATPPGEQITAIAELTRIDGNRLHLEVRAWDQHELIGQGTHTRYIIDEQTFMARVYRSKET
jgi:predicted thioesterase